LVELKGIIQHYYLWKDYFGRDNECVSEGNARARDIYEREKCSRVFAKRFGEVDEFWFKPITGKYINEVTLEEYVKRRFSFHFATPDKNKFVYEQEGNTKSDEEWSSDDGGRESKVIIVTSSFNTKGRKSTTTHILECEGSEKQTSMWRSQNTMGNFLSIF